jgi:hypothetical protein
MARDDVEAAYFALLRARDDVSDLQRYREYLDDETRRLRRSTAEADALSGQVAPRLRRRLLHTDAPLAEAVKGRLEVIHDERRWVDAQLEAAEAYVTECESEHDRLRRTA